MPIVASIAEHLKNATLTIEDSGSDSARVDAEYLLCHVLQQPKSYLLARAEQTLPKSQATELDALIKRRATGEPIAYIIGKQGFWQHDFIVNQHTLIPRGDTEVIIDYVLNQTTCNSQAKLCDLGTGTGCIGISIALERPAMQITLVDKSEDALAVAKRNRDALHAHNTQCVHSNWLDTFGTQSPRVQFDWILSNPPYIREGDHHLEQGDVRFEPRSALTAGASGLDDIVRIQEQAKAHLVSGGQLVLELGHDQSEAVTQLLKSSGYQDIQPHFDYNRIIRAVSARFIP